MLSDSCSICGVALSPPIVNSFRVKYFVLKVSFAALNDILTSVSKRECFQKQGAVAAEEKTTVLKG